ncbi:MAG: glycosyltransferase [Cyanothece sp. SIO1E1]|nr:glycosyltransferase [Cyanothece sp. SIO1E1]
MKINFISNLNPTNTSGGWGGINHNIFRQLQRSYDTNYIGPVNPPFKLHERYVSKALRLLGRRGKFAFFSNSRLEKISRITEQNIKNADTGHLNFYFGQTPWIKCNSMLPYVCYLDADFLTYLEVFSTPSQFQKRDIERIAKLESEWLQKATIIFYGSNWAKDLTQKHYGLPDDKIKNIVVNTGGHMSIPAYDAYDHYSNGIKLLFISLNFEKKGGIETWKSFKLLKEDFPDAQLSIIGQSPPAEVLGTPGVNYLGLMNKNVPQEYRLMEKELSKATFLVHPTKMDTMGAVIVEAGYFGCPTIAPKLFGIPDLIRNQETGFLLPENFTEKDIVGAIKSGLRHLEGYFAMRKSCRKYVTEKFSWNAIGNQINNSISTLKL